MKRIVKKDKLLVLAKNSWSEVEGKLFATLIKELNPKEESDFREMKITIDEIEELWGKKQVNTTEIRKVCLELKRKAYEIPEFNENGKLIKYKYRSLFHSIDYEVEKRYISFKFHDDLKPLLLEFVNNFVKYNIENILKFKSKYSISFYERFKLDLQFKRETSPKVMIDLEEFREWLNIKNKYKRVNDIKRYILEPVAQDLKKYSDVYMYYDFVKEGRKVIGILFRFVKNLKEDERQLYFFDKNDLKSEYDKYIGLKYTAKNKDGIDRQMEIIRIVRALKNNDYITALVRDIRSKETAEVDIDKSILIDFYNKNKNYK